jgi:hypothetical protein
MCEGESDCQLKPVCVTEDEDFGQELLKVNNGFRICCECIRLGANIFDICSNTDGFW